MSLIRLGSAATRRRFDQAPVRAITESIEPPAPRVSATRPETETETERAFQQLVEYFPTETVTLFFAAVSTLNSFDHIPAVASVSPLWLIAVFTVLTPLMLLLAAYATHRETLAKMRRSDPAAPDMPFKPPVFDLCASAIAFVPWALSVPGVFPEIDNTEPGWSADEAQVLAVFLAFLVSWFLSQLRRIYATA